MDSPNTAITPETPPKPRRKHKKPPQINDDDIAVEELRHEVLERVKENDEITKGPVFFFRPEIIFRTLTAFQKQGLYLIDIEEGIYVEGPIAGAPSIGLTFTPPPPKKWRSSLGFLSLGQNKESDTSQTCQTVEIDAMLHTLYDGPECTTGALKQYPGGEISYLFFIVIWNDYEMHIWDKIINKVVADCTKIIDGIPTPLAHFTVTTSFVPGDPTQTNRLVIRLGKNDDDDDLAVNAVSKHSLQSQEYDSEDDRIKFKPRF